MNKTSKVFASFLIVLIVLSSCSTTHKLKKENKKFDKISSGIRYSAYTAASNNSVPKLVEKYNNNYPNKQISEADIHSYLGFIMLLANQNRFAIAESNLVLKNESNAVNKYTVQNLLASVKYNKDWKLSAETNIDKALEIKSTNPELDSLNFSYYSSELTLAYLHLKQQEYVKASADFTRLSAVTGVLWPAKFCNLFSDIKSGENTKANKRYEEIMKDNSIPTEIKDWASKNIPKLIENPKKLQEINSTISTLFKVYISGKVSVKAPST